MFISIKIDLVLVNIILGNIETNAAADINNDNNINVGDIVSLVNLILQQWFNCYILLIAC